MSYIESEKRECLDRLKTLAADEDLPTDIQNRLYQVVDFIAESEQFENAADHLADTYTILVNEYEYHEDDGLLVSIDEVEMDLLSLSMFDQFGQA